MIFLTSTFLTLICVIQTGRKLYNIGNHLIHIRKSGMAFSAWNSTKNSSGAVCDDLLYRVVPKSIKNYGMYV